MNKAARHEWIQKRIREMRLSQAALARLLKVDPAAITNIIKGSRQVKSFEIPVIAKFLGMSEAEVVSRLNGCEKDSFETSLSPDEIALLQKYRASDGRGRKQAHAVLDVSGDEQECGCKSA